jgi:hypothetical protein
MDDCAVDGCAWGERAVCSECWKEAQAEIERLRAGIGEALYELGRIQPGRVVNLAPTQMALRRALDGEG